MAVVLVLAALAFWQRPRLFDSAEGEATPGNGDAHVRSRSVGPATSASLPSLPSGDSILARGVVLDSARGRAIGGTGVTAVREGVAVLETKAGDDGAFQLLCRRGDLLETRPAGHFRAKAPCAETVEFRAVPALGIEGRVVFNGKGVPGARVSCLFPGSQFPWTELGVDAGPLGEFSVNCGSSETRLSAQSAFAAPVFLDVGAQVPGAVLRDVVLELRPGRRVRGHVADHSGSSISADMLVLESTSVKKSLFVRSDMDGLFEIGVSFEPHAVTVIASDGRCVRAEVPAGTQESVLDLTLPEGNVLRGRLTGAFEGASVSAARRNPAPDEAAKVRDAAWLHAYRKATMEGDRFSLSGLEPGTYSLSAWSTLAAGAIEIEVPADVEPVIAMEARDYVLLNVSRDGVAQSGSIEILGGGRRRHAALREGKADVGSLDPGEYAISHAPLVGPVPAPTHVRVSKGANEITWELSSSFTTFEGTVLDASTEKPIADVQVTPATTGGGQNIHPLSLTDQSGGFRFEAEDPTTPLFFLREGYASQIHPAREASVVRLVPGASSRSVKPKP